MLMVIGIPMKNDENTELPGAPPVPETKDKAEPKAPITVAEAMANSKKDTPPPAKAETPSQKGEPDDDEIAKQTSDAITDEENAVKVPKEKSKGKIRQFFSRWW